MHLHIPIQLLEPHVFRHIKVNQSAGRACLGSYSDHSIRSFADATPAGAITHSTFAPANPVSILLQMVPTDIYLCDGCNTDDEMRHEYR